MDRDRVGESFKASHSDMECCDVWVSKESETQFLLMAGYFKAILCPVPNSIAPLKDIHSRAVLCQALCLIILPLEVQIQAPFTNKWCYSHDCMFCDWSSASSGMTYEVKLILWSATSYRITPDPYGLI